MSPNKMCCGQDKGEKIWTSPQDKAVMKRGDLTPQLVLVDRKYRARLGLSCPKSNSTWIDFFLTSNVLQLQTKSFNYSVN